MMSNETFALLTPLAILAAVLGTGGLLYWDIVRRHPAKKKRPATPAASASDFAEQKDRSSSTVTAAETLENEELNRQLATRLRDNAATTARIVREANQLAASVEGFTKAVTGAK
jgi:transposase InsO family protein